MANAPQKPVKLEIPKGTLTKDIVEALHSRLLQRLAEQAATESDVAFSKSGFSKNGFSRSTFSKSHGVAPAE